MFLKAIAGFLYGIALLLFLGSCARRDESGEPGIQEIAAQWMVIERTFLTSAGATVPPGLVKETGDFSVLVERFLDSRMYRMYHYIPFSRPDGIAALWRPPPPNEFGADQAV
jgi:hypothetical protein